MSTNHSSESDRSKMQEVENTRQHMRQQMLDNLNRAALESAPSTTVVLSPEQKEQAQKDAAALLEFGAYLVAAPDKSPAEAKALEEQAQELVRDITLMRFTEAIKELRVIFLALLLPKDDRPSGLSAPDVTRSRENFLEWLTRLDLQRALVAEKNLGADFDENRDRFMAIDQAFGPPANFWAAFSQLKRS